MARPATKTQVHRGAQVFILSSRSILLKTVTQSPKPDTIFTPASASHGPIESARNLHRSASTRNLWEYRGAAPLAQRPLGFPVPGYTVICYSWSDILLASTPPGPLASGF